MLNPTPVMPVDSTSAPALLEIVETPGLFADAALTDERGSLLFLSFWGRDTATQQLFAQLTVKIEEGGLRALNLRHPDGHSTHVQLDRMEMTDKHTARMPARNLFGNLIHVWLYNCLAIEPDRANRHALLLFRPHQDSDESTDDRLWTLVRELCHLPLLPHWREPVLSLLEARQWMQRLDGHGISAWRLDLGQPELEAEISRMVRCRQLTLDNADLAAALTARHAQAA
jgi:hypothetical protein